MAAMSTEREYVFEQRDLEVMQTAAGQVSVAVENARLFAEEQRRSKQLAFLNNISKMAISSEDAEQMLADIVAEIQKNFQLDHIGIGILDYVTKEIEIKAEAGTTAQARGKRIPLGTGILGRVARTDETFAGAQRRRRPPGRGAAGLALCAVHPDHVRRNAARRAEYREPRENAFSPQDVLIMNTLADLLATALHNSFVFQKLQQQSITDGLTGIKTRRFFWEALSSEWKRASRSGRPFSVVLIDLDKFKEVNDSLGHLEGDLVLARVGRLARTKMPAIERGRALWRRRVHHPYARDRRRAGADPGRTFAPVAGDRSHAGASTTLRAASASRASRSTASPIEDLIRVADAGMYVAKHAGGDRVSMAAEFGDTRRHRRCNASMIVVLYRRLSAARAQSDRSIWKIWSRPCTSLCGEKTATCRF